MKSKRLVDDLIEKYGDQILPVYDLPQPYCPGGINNVKAILLGCDPSNKHCYHLPYVFALESGIPIFNKFIFDLEANLEQIGLNWQNIYAQNLCKNYFQKETSQNLTLWKIVSKEYWIEKLKEELKQFNTNIPVLLTSQYLLNVLLNDGVDEIPALDYYQCKKSIPIPACDNKLNRDLIPLYRGQNPNFKVSYHLKNSEWESYKISIIEFLKQAV